MSIFRTAQPFGRPAKTPPGRDVRPISLRVKEIQEDTLRCRSFTVIPAVVDDPGTDDVDESAPARTVESTSDIIVLRPYLLRETPFHHKQRLGEWYDYSGLIVEPLTLRPIPLGGVLYTPDHVTRTAFRVGPGRDANSNPVIESVVQRVLPQYAPSPVVTEDSPVPGLAFSPPDVIQAIPIRPVNVVVAGTKVKVGLLEIDGERQWYVASRVMLPGVLEGV